MLSLLVRVDDLESGGSQQYAFDKSPVRIGRNPMNDLALDSPFISQWHGLVRFDDSTTEYSDLGSTNGTLANGKRLQQNVPLQVAGNVELRVSSLRFFCWRGERPVNVASTRPSAKSLGPWSSMVLDSEKRAQVLGEGEASLAVKQLKPLYEQYRSAWASLNAGIRQAVAQMPAQAQASALVRLQRELPALTGEEDFRLLAEQHQVALTGSAPMASGAARIVEEFARTLVPSLRLSSLGDVEKVLTRAATALETSARAFVELRKGQEQFGTEMAVRTVNEMTPLHRAKDAKEVLAHLLDPGADVSERIQELTSAYADIMVHQVALLNGMMEGVRSLLRRFSPSEIDAEVKQTATPLVRLLAPFRARWRAFVERHREYSEEERQLSAAVFGAEFARAYAAVIGEEQSPRLLAARRS
jgi:type VI secretion system protein ImpI